MRLAFLFSVSNACDIAHCIKKWTDYCVLLRHHHAALLAADLAIISNDEIPLRYREQARALNLDLTETLAMRSVVAFGESLQLTKLKAVAAGYPLRGKVLVASAPFADPAPTTITSYFISDFS